MLYSTIPFSTITFGGFNPLAAIAGLVIFFQISQIYYYGLPENEPSVELSETGSYKYLQKQFIGVQVVTALIAASVMLAGPDKIFFPFNVCKNSRTNLCFSICRRYNIRCCNPKQLIRIVIQESPYGKVAVSA